MREFNTLSLMLIIYLVIFISISPREANNFVQFINEGW